MPRPPQHAVRRLAVEMPSIKGLTLLPHGAAASLVNISETGLLAESKARLPVSSPVLVQFRGSFTPSSVVGRVVRCEVTAMGQDGQLRYGLAIEFASPIALGDDVSAAAPQERSRAVRNRW